MSRLLQGVLASGKNKFKDIMRKFKCKFKHEKHIFLNMFHLTRVSLKKSVNLC